MEIPDRKELELEYESRRSQYEKILYELQINLSERIEDGSTNFTIKSRIKSFNSYYEKLLKRLKKLKNYNTANNITDILALRIVCPFLENVKNVEYLIKDNYEIVESEHKGEGHSFKEFGYVSLHYLIKVPSGILSQNKIEDNIIYEVQICTILQDAWAEVEHELVYKNEEFSPYDETLKRKLAALNANLTLSDVLFQEIRNYQRRLKSQLKIRRENFFENVEAYESINLAPDLFTVNAPEIEFDKINIECEDIGKSQKEDLNCNIDDLLIEALDAHNKHQFKTAIALYSKILLYSIPVNIQVIVYIHRGMAYFAGSDYVRSLMDFADALKLEKNNYKALYYRGIVQRVLHNYQFALDDLNRCIQMEPYKFYPYLNRANIYFNMCDFPKALSDCKQALKIRPDSDKAQKFEETIQAGMGLRNILNG